jgi:hypothetical protein
VTSLPSGPRDEGLSLLWRAAVLESTRDALYCSTKCRVAANRARRTRPVEISSQVLFFAPWRWLQFPDDVDFDLTRWSSPIRCVICGRFTREAIRMSLPSATGRPLFCSWDCLGVALIRSGVVTPRAP